MGALSGTQRRILARQAVRRRAAREVEGGRRLLREDPVTVVRRDALQLLPVLVGHQDVAIVGGGPDRMGLARAARADLRAEAAQGRPSAGVQEDDVARGHEADHGVRVPVVVEDHHVRPHGVDARLGQAEGGGGGAEVHPLRHRRAGVPPELLGVVDVDRAPVGQAVGVRLVQQPDLVLEAMGHAGVAHVLPGGLDEGRGHVDVAFAAAAPVVGAGGGSSPGDQRQGHPQQDSPGTH